MRKPSKILAGLTGLVLGVSASTASAVILNQKITLGDVHTGPSATLYGGDEYNSVVEAITWSDGSNLFRSVSSIHYDFQKETKLVFDEVILGGRQLTDFTKPKTSTIDTGAYTVAFNATDLVDNKRHSYSYGDFVNQFDTGMGDIEQDFSLAFTPDNEQYVDLYVAGIVRRDANEGLNIIMNRREGPSLEIHKLGDQINPSVAVSPAYVILPNRPISLNKYYPMSMVYTDSDNKIKYRTSLDDYVTQTEESISKADQSYGGILKFDSNGTPIVIYKSTQDGFILGQELTSGNIYLAERINGVWESTRITDTTISYQLDRPLDLSVDEENGINIAWSQYNADQSLTEIMYAHKSPLDLKFNKYLIDSGNSNGYVSLGLINKDNVFLAAQVHSLDNYVINPNTIPEPASLALIGLGASVLLNRPRKSGTEKGTQ